MTAFQPGATVALHYRLCGYVYGSERFAYAALAVIRSPSSPLGPAPVKAPHFDAQGAYGLLIREGKAAVDLAQASKAAQVAVKAPSEPGEYSVVMAGTALFRDAPYPSSEALRVSFEPGSKAKSELDNLLKTSPAGLFEIIRFSVVKAPVAHEAPRVYLTLNGVLPSKAATPGGVQPNPLVFQWKVGPEFKRTGGTLLYRYRLDPDDLDWGAWTPRTGVAYSYVSRGPKIFQVRAKWSDGATELVSGAATSEFYLPLDHLSPVPSPEKAKAIFGVTAAPAPAVQFSAVYRKSRALLVGVTAYDDKAHFTQFPADAIGRDLAAMQAALERNGFEVSVLGGDRVTRNDVETALLKLVDQAGPDDRLLIYLSAHGFSDPSNPAEGYLATSDCMQSSPSVNCLRLNGLEAHATRALDGKNARQVLFVVDSCFSGLGVVAKSSGTTDTDLTQLATYKGAFMMTAGLPHQIAELDPQLRMSTFTHFLAQGLSGNARQPGGGDVISLSGLFAYVQYAVAVRTDGRQTPTMGRMKGTGEMLFSP